MITKLLKIIFRNFPKIKGIIWKKWYTYLGSKVITTELKFMSYGYFSKNFHPKLSNHDEKERYPIHLYHYLCSKINLYNLTILEVGSGRGGGADYTSRTFQPKEMYAVDISKSAIKLCNKFYTNNPKLNFIYGNAEKLPFKNNTFDVVLNIESSHCYPNFNNFLKEVVRVLKNSGYFLITDFRPNKELKTFRSSIKNNFEIIHEEISFT